ncbi:DASH family cryptochrome [Pseudoalteromonas sp. C2R02]|uniref:DASH family cryptochrome n=1 Tax=Pseudoalteromonas sp. C2R02 TaxID=2841565 RepID=UPI001C09D890|nr:DASH family cryptochrome [Pseudoalteromonas sp. C2R02]
MNYNKAVYWFTTDQRLNFNCAIDALLNYSSEVAFVFIFDLNWFKKNNFDLEPLGQNRLKYLIESLTDLQNELNEIGFELTLLMGDPVSSLREFTKFNKIDTLIVSEQVGSNERAALTEIKTTIPELNIIKFYNSTLLTPDDLPKPLKTYSKFRQFIEAQDFDFTLPESQLPPILPKAISTQSDITLNDITALFGNNEKAGVKKEQQLFFGGEKAAQYHLSHYFSTDAPSYYKETRNELDGWLNSTKFSPYLANGNVSAKQIWMLVDQYEADVIKNQSTYWIKFELLWREYFQWISIQQDIKLFKFEGIADKSPNTKYDALSFNAWCIGNTPYPLVNACMKQLNAIGYISNRGRQIVASCLINELNLDWRYGAAYFEKQLIDYDVAANWGNWQYIAGVGQDVQGGRHFHIRKQTELYDPEHMFIDKWT